MCEKLLDFMCYTICALNFWLGACKLPWDRRIILVCWWFWLESSWMWDKPAWYGPHMMLGCAMFAQWAHMCSPVIRRPHYRGIMHNACSWSPGDLRSLLRAQGGQRHVCKSPVNHWILNKMSQYMLYFWRAHFKSNFWKNQNS